jgi:anti-anti-sigma factor
VLRIREEKPNWRTRLTGGSSMDSIKKQGSDLKVVELNGRLDTQVSPKFEEQILADIDVGIRRVILDCGRLEYISGVGLRALLRIARRLEREQGTIILCGLKEYLNELFTITGLAVCLPIVNTVGDAMDRIQSAATPLGSDRTLLGLSYQSQSGTRRGYMLV